MNQYKPKYKENNCSLETLSQRNICEEAKKLINNSFVDGERHAQLPS
jgi:hypothetical protein